MSVPAGTNHVNAFRSLLERFTPFVGIEHFVADRVVDLIEDHQVVFAAVNRLAPGFPTFARQLDVLGVSFRAPDFHKASSHRSNLELVVAQQLRCVKFAVMPRTLDELHHHHPQPLSHGAKRGTQRASGLAFPRPGVNDQQSFFFRHGSLGGGRMEKCAQPYAKRQASWSRFTSSVAMPEIRRKVDSGSGAFGRAARSRKTIHKPGRYTSSSVGQMAPVSCAISRGWGLGVVNSISSTSLLLWGLGGRAAISSVRTPRASSTRSRNPCVTKMPSTSRGVGCSSSSRS